MTSSLKLGLILIVAGFVYLVGNSRTQLFDRDEPRYAQCSRQMLQSGDWVVPRLYDTIRAAKPPGIYWCQATAMNLLGDTAFAARLPSALAALLTIMLLALAVWREAGQRHALWTLFIFSSSALTIWCAKVCMTDAVLLLWVTGALICVYRVWQGRGGWWTFIGLAITVGFGGLVKGPFILGVLGGTVAMLAVLAAFDRWLDGRRRSHSSNSKIPVDEDKHVRLPDRRQPRVSALQMAVCLLLITAIVLPWILCVQHREPHFLSASTQDAVQHLDSGAEGHKGPPGYHLVLIWVTFLPWSLLLPLAIGLGFKNRRLPQVRFALAVVLGTWVFVEAVQTKLPHYMLSAFPALAFLTADAVIRCLDGQYRDLESRQMRSASIIWAAAIVLLFTVPWWWLDLKFHDPQWIALIAMSGLAVCAAAAVCGLMFWRRPRAALVCMGSASLALTAILFGVYFPRCQPLRLSMRVADVLKAHDVVHPGESLMLDYKEPSLAFYQGGTIREAKHSLVVLQHLDTASRWMVLTRQIWDQTTPAVRARLEVVGPPLNGFLYSDMKPIEVMVVRKMYPAPTTRSADQANLNH